MEFSPLKKVGSPASVKGVRGNYLTTLIMWVGGGLFVLLVLFILSLPFILRTILILFTIAIIVKKYFDLKKLSKGDIYLQTKQLARKKVYIKSKPNNIKLS